MNSTDTITVSVDVQEVTSTTGQASIDPQAYARWAAATCQGAAPDYSPDQLGRYIEEELGPDAITPVVSAVTERDMQGYRLD